MTDPIKLARECGAVLGAFKREDGRYNVWRYDTPQTVCVGFGIEAESESGAIEAIRALLPNRSET